MLRSQEVRNYITPALLLHAPIPVKVKLSSSKDLEGVAQQTAHVARRFGRHGRAGLTNQLVRSASLQARLPEIKKSNG